MPDAFHISFVFYSAEQQFAVSGGALHFTHDSFQAIALQVGSVVNPLGIEASYTPHQQRSHQHCLSTTSEPLAHVPSKLHHAKLYHHPRQKETSSTASLLDQVLQNQHSLYLYQTKELACTLSNYSTGGQRSL